METSIMGNLNCKTQAHARGTVCKENEESEGKNDFLVKRSTVRYQPRNTKEMDISVLTCDDISQYKGTKAVLYLYSNVCSSQNCELGWLIEII